MLKKDHDHHFEALVGLFLLLLSPIVWLVLGGDAFAMNQNPNIAWAFLGTFATVAYIAFLAFISLDSKKEK